MKATCLIVDDEPIAHRVLQHHIQKMGTLSIVGQAFQTDEARNLLRRHPVDLLFLDIKMPEETGLGMLQSLKDKPVTILTTAYLDYSLEGFELGVLDYLVKPIAYERFEKAVVRALELLDLIKLRQEKESVKTDEIHIKSGIRRYALRRADILYVQALKDYALIFTTDKKYVVRASMSDMLEQLGEEAFVRVHKSFIVAKAKAAYWTVGGLKIGDVTIPVGRTYRHTLPLHLQFDNDI
jgi:DNA-binding LytR/AlgR family response regulator